MFPKNRWEGWAAEWGLIHVPCSAWTGGSEAVAGARRGFLVHATRTGKKDGETIRVRFPAVHDLGDLRAHLVLDSTLDALPGGRERRDKMVDLTRARGLGLRVSDFFLSADDLMWWPVGGLDREPVATVSEGVDLLVAALARATKPFGAGCESCASRKDVRAVLAKERVALECAECREKHGRKARVALTA